MRGCQTVVGQWYASVTYFAVLPVLVFLCVSCAASSGETPDQSKVLTGYENNEQEITAEVNDKACAYFYFLWGRTAENNQRLQEAEEAYEKALVCDAESQYIRRSLAIILIKMNRKEQAVKVLQQIISRNPQDTENRILLAKVYSSLGRTDEAVAIYQELLAIKEEHDTLLLLGTLYAQNREYDKAQKILNRLIQLDDNSYLGYYYLARLYREMHYYDKAGAAYDKALELDWFERLAYEAAEFYESRKEYDKAVALYRRILNEGESGDMAKTRLVNLYLTLGENDKALELLRELRSVLPDSFNVDITISRILLSQEKYDEAVMILEDVLQTNPELTVVRYLLGLAYFSDKKLQKAQEQLKLIPAKSDLYEDSIFLRARILRQEDDIPGVIELLQQQINNADTRKPSFYILLGAIYRENDEIEHGREVYEQAQKIYPHDVDLLYNYGIFLEKIGEQEEAMAKMQAVLALDPDNGAALNYVGYTWADKNVNLEKALEYVERAVELLPDDGYVRDSLGWVYFKLGRIEQAIVELEKAAEMVDSDPVIREHLGDVYMQEGELDKARKYYEEAFELYEEEANKKKIEDKINSIMSRSTR